MSAQDLMNGFGTYTDVEELAAQAVVGVADQESTPTIWISVGVSVSLTAEHTC
ncbi:LxmA leader domain family RiPP [Streptomyces sp. NPDC014734]|uniref:LxmA leader domain family RiPP n=1 Tax=Streptomyces sp. NPDC014734 TaxID=3364886 RepID=UPI0036F5052D